MNQVVWLFPGVGSHYTGMVKELCDNFEPARTTFEEAADSLGINLLRMCTLPSEKEELGKLENSQTAILTASIAYYRVYLKESGILPDYCLGHSLGEYSALCGAGMIDFAAALKLVWERGIIISRAASSVDGTMMWVINLDTGVVERVCRDIFKEGQEVYLSAYDSPTQSSISGHTAAIMKAARKLEKEGAIVYPLKMSGPFHCPLMKEAAAAMRTVLSQYSYHPPVVPVIANRNALPYEGESSIPDNLSLQLVAPIRWRESLEYVRNHGVKIAVEVGPKDVLKFLLKKNTTEINAYALDNKADRKKLWEESRIMEVL